MYATGATTLTKLVKGSAADVLTMNAGATAPEWAASAGGGIIGQVLSTTLSSITSTTAATFGDISGFAISITPVATSSKIFITVGMSLGGGEAYSCQLQLMRDSTAICIGTDSGIGGSQPQATWQHKAYSSSAVHNVAMNFLDSPSSTSAISYNVEWRETEGTTLYMNRAWTTSNSANYPWCASTITVMEVLA